MLMAGSRAPITTIEAFSRVENLVARVVLTKLVFPPLLEGSESSNPLLSASQSVHFPYIVEKAETSHEMWHSFSPQHQRDPAHAGFARVGGHSLRAK
jgi:hypothetical protein